MNFSRIASYAAGLIAIVARDGIGIAGAILVAYGAWLAWHPAGFIVAGLMALGAAWLLGLRNES